MSFSLKCALVALCIIICVTAAVYLLATTPADAHQLMGVTAPYGGIVMLLVSGALVLSLGLFISILRRTWKKMRADADLYDPICTCPYRRRPIC